MKIIGSVKPRYVIRLKFNFSNQVSDRSKRQYLLFNYRKSTFILSKGFGIESLAFQNRFFDSAHSISNIKLSCCE